MRRQAQVLLLGGGLALAGIAVFLGLPLLYGVETSVRFVFPITVFGPLALGLMLPMIVGVMTFSGRLPHGAFILSILAAGGIMTAAAVNYAILEYAAFDPYVFGV